MVAPLDVRNQQGTVTGTVVLDQVVFGAEANVPLMHQVVVGQLAAARAGTQSTKTRAEVSGGGAKPFKQKGTGRARQGSTRAPHYTGGGIALGPKPRSYRQRTPRKMIRLALHCALSDRANDGRVLVVDKWDWPVPNTNAARDALVALGASRRVLVVLSREDETAYKSFRNLPEVHLILASELAAYDVLCADWVIFQRNSVPGNSVWAEAAPVAARPAGADKAATPPAPPVAAAAPAEEPPAAAVTDPIEAEGTDAQGQGEEG
jgi:large subunit ribosomal protein L4